MSPSFLADHTDPLSRSSLSIDARSVSSATRWRRLLAAVADSNLAISVWGERWSSGVRGDRSCGRRGAGSAGAEGGAARGGRLRRHPRLQQSDLHLPQRTRRNHPCCTWSSAMPSAAISAYRSKPTSTSRCPARAAPRSRRSLRRRRAFRGAYRSVSALTRHSLGASRRRRWA